MTSSTQTLLVCRAIAGLAKIAAVAGLAPGCLDRPICPDPDHPDACSPNVKNVFVSNVKQDAVDKIDLLFMIDNSSSMADKQKLLGSAVPELVGRLVNPICVDADGNPGGETPKQPEQACPAGFQREFKPIKDIHIGIVTSSLGGHGSAICGPSAGRSRASARAHAVRCGDVQQRGLPGVGPGPEGLARRRARCGQLEAELREHGEAVRADRLRLRGVARGVVPVPGRSGPAAGRRQGRRRHQDDGQGRRVARGAPELPAPGLAARHRDAHRRERLLGGRRRARLAGGP